MKKKCLMLIYAEPARFPPLIHMASALQADGFALQIFGLEQGATSAMGDLESVTTRLHGHTSGLVGKWTYLRYVVRACVMLWTFAPSIIIIADPFMAPLANLLMRLTRRPVIYQEHDSPPASEATSNGFRRFLWRQRRKLLRQCSALVMPNQIRLQDAISLSGRRADDPSFCVWNAPSANEIACAESAPAADNALRLYFHGSINDVRLPMALLDVMAFCRRHITLRFRGYETAGSFGYVQEFLQKAAQLGLAERVTHGEELPHKQLLLAAESGQLGLCIYERGGTDANHERMLGASNKPFDYLLMGQGLLFVGGDEWQSWIDQGLGWWFPLNDPPAAAKFLDEISLAEINAANARGRLKIQADWNFAAQFKPLQNWIAESLSS
jgi:Glycosyl transferase 4-like domain